MPFEFMQHSLLFSSPLNVCIVDNKIKKKSTPKKPNMLAWFLCGRLM